MDERRLGHSSGRRMDSRNCRSAVRREGARERDSSCRQHRTSGGDWLTVDSEDTATSFNNFSGTLRSRQLAGVTEISHRRLHTCLQQEYLDIALDCVADFKLFRMKHSLPCPILVS